MKFTIELGNDKSTGLKKVEDKVTEVRDNRYVDSFLSGSKKALTNRQTVIGIGVAGVVQGLKYKGSISNGLKGAAWAAVGAAVTGGVLELMEDHY